MKKKTIGIGILIGVLLIGIVSASLLDYFGVITGTAMVTAPVFYASGEHPLGGTTYWGLGLNEFIERDDPVSFTGGDTKWFISDSLGIDSFYAANYEMSIEAESNNESGQIDAELWFVEKDHPNNKKKFVCFGSTTTPVYSKAIYKIENCQAGELTNINPNWRLVWILSDGANSIHYDIYIKGDTKIKVTAI